MMYNTNNPPSTFREFYFGVDYLMIKIKTTDNRTLPDIQVHRWNSISITNFYNMNCKVAGSPDHFGVNHIGGFVKAHTQGYENDEDYFKHTVKVKMKYFDYIYVGPYHIVF